MINWFYMINRLELINQIRNKIKIGKPSIGSWIQTGSAENTEILSDAGYDWLVIDMEHGSISMSNLPDLIRACLINECLPLVRVSDDSASKIKSALDAGAGGIMIPNVMNAEQINNIIQKSCWPPNGNRGIGYSRANLYGKYFEEYKVEAQHPLVIAQIEHIKAIDNLEFILECPFLDIIFIGPYDLSASLGINGDFQNSTYLNALKKFESKINDRNVTFGIHIVNPDKSKLLSKIENNYLFNAYGTDAIFLIKNSSNPILE